MYWVHTSVHVVCQFVSVCNCFIKNKSLQYFSKGMYITQITIIFLLQILVMLLLLIFNPKDSGHIITSKVKTVRLILSFGIFQEVQ